MKRNKYDLDIHFLCRSSLNMCLPACQGEMRPSLVCRRRWRKKRGKKRKRGKLSEMTALQYSMANFRDAFLYSAVSYTLELEKYS